MDSKRIVITGASSGIGKALALLLSHSNHKLVLVGRRENVLREVAEECSKNGTKEVAPVVCDVSKESDIPKVVDAVTELGEGEIVLVNNAGIYIGGAVSGIPPKDISSLVNINLLGPLLMTYFLSPLMLKEGKGQIINVLSIAAEDLFDHAAIYGATKAGLLYYSKILSRELIEKGIRVSSVLPGNVDTPMWRPEDKPAPEYMLSAQAYGKLGKEMQNIG